MIVRRISYKGGGGSKKENQIGLGTSAHKFGLGLVLKVPRTSIKLEDCIMSSKNTATP